MTTANCARPGNTATPSKRTVPLAVMALGAGAPCTYTRKGPPEAACPELFSSRTLTVTLAVL